MGQQTSKSKCTLSSQDLEWKFYTVTRKEGDPELPEDPDFPETLVEQTKDLQAKTGDGTEGTYVFYPDQSKPKMWIGQYVCQNPCDILENVCSDAMCPGAAFTGAVPTSSKDSLQACGLIDGCLQATRERSDVSEYQDGHAQYPRFSSQQMNSHTQHLQQNVANGIKLITGTQFADANFVNKLQISQKIASTNAPAHYTSTNFYTNGGYQYSMNYVPGVSYDQCHQNRFFHTHQPNHTFLQKNELPK